MNVSSSFTRCGVFLTYFPHTPCNMSCALFWDLEAGFETGFAGVDVVVGAAAGVRGFGAMLAVVVRIEVGGQGRFAVLVVYGQLEDTHAFVKPINWPNVLAGPC